jgi:hypothetical protein
MASRLSSKAVIAAERREYQIAMFVARHWMLENLFGSGTDVKRMDSSMRAWYIKMWSNTYENDTLTPDELNHARENLFTAHCGGELYLDENLCADVPEGATTGAAGVSTLESTYRWATDLLGVVLNVQLIILWELKYLAKADRRRSNLRKLLRKIDRTSDTVDGLACREVGTDWLLAKRCFDHPTGQLAPVSRRMILRCNRILMGGRRRASDDAVFPPCGPGTALFDALLPIVAHYYHNVVNGDDDWNTFPLAHFIPDMEWHKILDPEVRCAWLRRGPSSLHQGMARRVVGQTSMSKAFQRMRLPTKLNEEKGVEGEGLHVFCFNSMRPVVDGFGNWTFAIKGMTMEDEFRAISHPDEQVKHPIHTCLRLIGLSLLNPDPRCYELTRSIYEDVLVRHDLPLIDGLLDLSAYEEFCNKEKSNSFYHLSFEPDHELYTSLNSGKVGFPSYDKILALHGLPRQHYGTGSTEERLLGGAPRSPGW